MISAPIPQDIMSLIIEQHLFNDTSTLKACSLSSRSLVAPSQKGLFHTIHHDLRAQQHCQRLHRVFLDNPELLTYVRELYVKDYSEELRGLSLSIRESLHAILKMFPFLRLFSYVFTDTISWLMEWKSMSVELLLAAFTLPTLRTCMLKGVNLPAAFFNSAKHLKKLYLSGVSIVRDPVGLSAPSVDSRKVQLESLALSNISDDDALFWAIRDSVNLSQLRDVSIFSEHPSVVWEATKNSMGSLETLTWDFYIEHVGFSAVKLHLSDLTKLRVLRVGAEPRRESQFDMIVWLVSSLKEIALAVGDGVSNLEEITVHLDCVFPEMDAATYVSQIRNSALEDLDVLLASSPKFSRLRKFKIYVYHLPQSNVLQDVERLLCASMSGLSKKGFLEMQSTTLRLEGILAGEV